MAKTMARMARPPTQRPEAKDNGNADTLEHDPIRLNRIMLQIPLFARNLTANRPGALRPIN
jgi:hypothetical protein